jgi:hypothetical protein
VLKSKLWTKPGKGERNPEINSHFAYFLALKVVAICLPKHQAASKLHGVTTQKTVVFIRTSNSTAVPLVSTPRILTRRLSLQLKLSSSSYSAPVSGEEYVMYTKSTYKIEWAKILKSQNI